MRQTEHLRPADAEHRALILRVAHREFLQKNFEGCSVQRIAASEPALSVVHLARESILRWSAPNAYTSADRPRHYNTREA